MAAAIKPVAFEHDGVSYSVAYPVNALCALEEQFDGRSIVAIGQMVSDGSAGARGVRALWRASLLDDHPNISDVDAGRLLSELGAEEAGELVQAAFDRVMAGLAADIPELPNPDARGRLSFEADGRRWTFSFGMNAQAELEDWFGGLKPHQIGWKLDHDGASIRDMRAMFRAALIDAEDMTLDQAGAAMERIGVKLAGRAMQIAYHAAFPKKVDEEVDAPVINRAQRRAGGKAKSNPTAKKAKGGTGKG